MSYRIGLLCIPAICACLAQDSKAPPPPPPPLEVQLLQEAYSLSVNFAPEERVAILLKLTQASAGMQPELTESWSIELLELATKRLQPGQYRSAMQKNALTSLAQIDPIRSADLFMSLEPPTAPLPNEDVRSFAARTIFSKLWEKEGPAALPKIREIANWLGSTGQYPYSAMAGIILGIAKTDQEKARELFSETVSFLPSDPGFIVTNKQFVVDFLLRTYAVPDKAILGGAISQALSAIERAEKIKDRRAMHFELMGDAGKISLSSESEYLVYRLLPLIEQIGEQWAKQVREKYKGVPSSSLGAAVNVAGAVGSSGGSTDGAFRDALDGSTLQQAPALAAQDPAQALQWALSIADPDMRRTALAAVLPAYSAIDRKKSTEGMHDISKQLDEMKPGIGKLQLMTTLIEGYFTSGRDKDAQALIGRAFDLGEELVVRDLEANPGKAAYAATGFDEIMRLAEMTATRAAETYDLLSKIRQVRSEIVRANLLSSMAKGLFSVPRSRTA